MACENGSLMVRTFKDRPPITVGQKIICPECGRLLIEADCRWVLTRCRHCQIWVLAEISKGKGES